MASNEEEKRKVSYNLDEETIKKREAYITPHSVHPLILNRRSLINMINPVTDAAGGAIDRRTLFDLFEAARWAPSLYNTQSWRFVWVDRQTAPPLPTFEQYLRTLDELNQVWAQNSAILLVVISKRQAMIKGKLRQVPSASFDTGAAAMTLQLEAAARGLVVHPMAGFDRDAIQRVIGLDKLQQQQSNDEYRVEVMIAIGKAENRESYPFSFERNPIDRYTSEGVFGG